jgi:hypothetical protein
LQVCPTPSLRDIAGFRGIGIAAEKLLHIEVRTLRDVCSGRIAL